jgi:sterol desaturase/sphingolipid hydroxylase (fatty acid hydroxylase superfamily)
VSNLKGHCRAGLLPHFLRKSPRARATVAAVHKPASLAAWAVFPLILGGAITLAIGLLPFLRPPIVLLVVQPLAVLAIVVCERLFPYRTQWNRSHGDVGTDVLHAVVSGVGTTQLVRPLIQAAGVGVAGALSRAVGLPLWPADSPLIAQLALALVVAELPQYWLHRWQHEHDWLWRFHSVHHSAPRLYWLNAARFHPLDLGPLYVVGYLPLVALGAPEAVIMLFTLFDAAFGMLQHCNIDVRLGPLNRIFSMAEPHRWHHSRVLGEANANYGSNLIVWDLVFGSFFLPADRPAPTEIGIAGMPSFPSRYVEQLVTPFRWRRVVGEAAVPPPSGEGVPALGRQA